MIRLTDTNLEVEVLTNKTKIACKSLKFIKRKNLN